MVEHERERKGNINPHLAGSEFDPLFLSLHFLLLLGSVLQLLLKMFSCSHVSPLFSVLWLILAVC